MYKCIFKNDTIHTYNYIHVGINVMYGTLFTNIDKYEAT